MTEIEKLEAQVAEWMGVANQQILRIQELEKQLEVAQASSEHVLDNIIKLLEHRIAVLTQQLAEASQQRDSAEALAKDAVEVLKALKCEVGGSLANWNREIGEVIGYTNVACIWRRYEDACALLSRSDVKAIGGGK